MTATPLISTIIPVYNGERFLAEAVDSVRGQRYPELEIIVVDDGSTDGTAQVARRLGDPVRYEGQPNRGAPAARNRGMELARGQLIAFLDADDVWTPDKLELQVSRLLAEPDLELAIGMTQLMRAEGTDGSADYHPVGEAGLIPSLGSALFRKEAFDRLGRLDESLRMDDDVDWFLRALENDVRMAVIPQVVQYYRRHEGNITNARGVDLRFFLVAIKKSLERRRAAPGGAVRALGRWPAGRAQGTG